MGKWDLSNKKAIVTGGTKGIGKAIVLEFLNLGAEVLFTARNSETTASMENELREQGWKAHGIAGDINEASHRKKIKAWIQQHWIGKLDILVNNAGINIRKPSADYSIGDYNLILATNLAAVFELTKLLFPALQNAHGSAVVNIASVAGSFDVQTGAPYGISKAGVIQMTRNLAGEWASSGIRVNSISPWFTQTPLTKGLLANEEQLSAILGRTPMGRIAKASEIATAVAFMAMDQASFITGQNLSVDGGVTIGLL